MVPLISATSSRVEVNVGCRYCPECMLPLCDAPKVRLPLSVKIVTCAQEKRTKCTGVQAALLAPEHASLVDYESVIEETAVKSGTAAVLFPDDDAITPDNVDLHAIDTIFIVDRSVLSLLFSRNVYI